MERVVLIDSNYLCYRGLYSTNSLRYYGIRTGIIFSFFNQLIKIAEVVRPDNFLFFWDSKSSKRKKILPIYKENRRKKQLSEVELEERRVAFIQFSQLRKKILPEIGFHNNIIQKGYESDDTIARYVLDNNTREDLVIATADDDMLQLLGSCKIFNLHRNKYYTAEQFRRDYGIEPKLWIKVKMIAGCTSDNVPGVPGVGEKTALKYLTGGLKKSTKAYRNIVASPEVAEFNHKLVALPFPGTKRVIASDNQFHMLAFLRMCRRFGMNSFRREDKKVLIKQFFSKGGISKMAKKTKKTKQTKRVIAKDIDEDLIITTEDEEETPARKKGKTKGKKAKVKKAKVKKVEGKAKVLDQDFIDEILEQMEDIENELEDCLEKKVANKRARKISMVLGKTLKEFRKRSIAFSRTGL